LGRDEEYTNVFMPDLNCAVQPTFEPLKVPGPSFQEGPVVKGVLLGIGLPHLPSEGETPDVRLEFLETNLRSALGYISHTDMLAYSPYQYERTELPTIRLPRNPPLSLAVRYDINPGFVCKLDLMMDTAVGDVRERPDYVELRNTVALACGSALVGRHGEALSAGILLHHTVNFSSRRPKAEVLQFQARNLDDLAVRLRN
jgi:hypothetical protein